jgi:hypothetical protein
MGVLKVYNLLICLFKKMAIGYPGTLPKEGSEAG